MKIYQRIKDDGLKNTMIQGGHAIILYTTKYPFRKRYYTRKIHNFKMRLDLNDPGVSRQLAIRGTREPLLKYIIENSVKRGYVVCDLGANIGYYTLMMAKIINSEGYIYALEPSSENFALLKQNIQLNNLVRIVSPYQIGASNKIGKERFYISAYSNLNTFYPGALNSHDHALSISDKNYIDIPVTDLTTFFRGKRPIDLIRMDVEGYEVEIIEGLEEAIKSREFRGKILFEVHGQTYNDTNHCMREKLIMLFKNGYKTTMISSNDDSSSTIQEKYKRIKTLKLNAFQYYSLYTNITDEDAIRFICDEKGVRDLLLEQL